MFNAFGNEHYLRIDYFQINIFRLCQAQIHSPDTFAYFDSKETDIRINVHFMCWSDKNPVPFNLLKMHFFVPKRVSLKFTCNRHINNVRGLIKMNCNKKEISNHSTKTQILFCAIFADRLFYNQQSILFWNIHFCYHVRFSNVPNKIFQMHMTWIWYAWRACID